MRLANWLVLLASLAFASSSGSAYAEDPSIIKREFIFDTAPFKACHASTIEQTKNGFVAAWFGGTAEGKADVGIWVSRYDGNAWSAPVEVATGQNAAGERVACWNPVLARLDDRQLVLFYKVSDKIKSWIGVMRFSADGGATWSPPKNLPEGMLGPIKNKPIRLSDGDLLCPTSSETEGWRVYFERMNPSGASTRTEFLNDGKSIAAIQPTLVDHGAQGIQMLCRTKQGLIGESWSHDLGKTWDAIGMTKLPNPNSGIDAVQLRDGRSLLVYNHTAKTRSPLNVAVSNDGKTWQSGPVLETETGEYSYPAVIQSTDGMVHVTYTWKRLKIRHVVIDPSKLKLEPLPAD